MRPSYQLAARIQRTQSLRWIIEYAIAFGAAVLAGYLILQGHW